MEIQVKIIADSISKDGDQITTFELLYPRFIHGELMTHRLFSRNAASSRAIPIDKVIEMVENEPAMPVHWGLNQSGMQAKEEHKEVPTCVWAWKQAAKRAVESAKELQALGLHKQIVNRVLEPFQMMKTVVTATEYDNFFWLRCDSDAQPEIHVLADLMYEAYTTNTPVLLERHDWHLPYYKEGYLRLTNHDHSEAELEEALKISASCCAQVSYRLLDDSLDKAIKIYDQLVSMSPVHASPFEHQATPMSTPLWTDALYRDSETGLDKGTTHVALGNKAWSGNLQGWVQHRQLIDNNTCWNYEGH